MAVHGDGTLSFGRVDLLDHLDGNQPTPRIQSIIIRAMTSLLSSSIIMCPFPDPHVTEIEELGQRADLVQPSDDLAVDHLGMVEVLGARHHQDRLPRESDVSSIRSWLLPVSVRSNTKRPPTVSSDRT